MKITKKAGNFVPHPATTNLTRAVIVDVTPLKKMGGGQYPERDTFKLVYESEILDESGRNFCVWSIPYTPSLHEKANFRKDLKKILNRDLSVAEENEFESESLIGIPVQIIVKHEVKNGEIYAQISHVQPDASGNPMKPSGKFIREQDRPRGQGQQHPDAGGDDQPYGSGEGAAASYRKAPGSPDAGRPDWTKCKIHMGPHTGIDLGDLDRAVVLDLMVKFGGKHVERIEGKLADRKPTADDKRLYAALQDAVDEINGPAAPTKSEADY